MRAIKKLFGGIVFLALIAGVAYGYIWYQTKTFLDRAVVSSAPYAQLSYRSFFVDPRGEIRVEGIQLVPQGYRSPVDIKAISLKSKDPLFFLDAQGRVERGELPEFLSIAVDDLAADTAADFVVAMEPSEAEMLLNSGVNFEALGCGDVQAFTPKVSTQMGIGRTVNDLAFTLRADNGRGTLDLFSEVDTQGLFSVKADLSLTFAAGYLKPDTFAAANPRLKAIEISYQDIGYFSKRDRFCAGLAGVDEVEYREKHLQLVKLQAQNLAMEVPEVLWNAYMDATASGADVRFGMDPVGGLGAEAMLGLGSPVELIDRLRLHLVVNARPVDLSQVDWLALMPDPEAMLHATQPEVVDEAVSDSQALEPVAVVDEVQAELSAPVAESAVQVTEFPGMAPKPVPAPPVKYRKTEFDDLVNYIYSDIRIYTYYGNRVEGRLEAVEGDSIKILQRVGKGSAIYPVDREKLDVIEVMR